MADYNPTGRARVQSSILRETTDHEYTKHSIAGSSIKFDNDVADVTSKLFDLLIRSIRTTAPRIFPKAQVAHSMGYVCVCGISWLASTT
jgi:hypothetical protein